MRQANSRYEMANKPKLEKKECMVEEKGKTNILKRKRRQKMAARKVTRAGYT